MIGNMKYVIQMKGVYKSFGGVKALNNVDFEVGVNEIVGLGGDNGAGMSTLIKILTGVYPPDKGEIYIRNVRINLERYSVSICRKLGIEAVYQERSLGENQPLWRNIFIGRPITNFLGFIDIKKEKEETMNILKKLIGLKAIGVSVDSSAKKLSGGEQQGLAIGRAMYFNANIIILDEPTTALSLKEVSKVMNFVRNMKERGNSCILITHNINHMYSLSDRIVILDKGRIVRNLMKDKISLNELSDSLMMIAEDK